MFDDEIKEWRESWKDSHDGMNYSESCGDKYAVVFYGDNFQYIGKVLGVFANHELGESEILNYPIFVVEKDDGVIKNEYTEQCRIIK